MMFLDIEAERLHHLIDDMLVLSQIENAKPDSTEQRCDVAQEIRETVARLYPIAEKANITLKSRVKRWNLCCMFLFTFAANAWQSNRKCN